MTRIDKLLAQRGLYSSSQAREPLRRHGAAAQHVQESPAGPYERVRHSLLPPYSAKAGPRPRLSSVYCFACSASHILRARRAAPSAAVDCGMLTAVTFLPSSSVKISVMASLLATPPENTMGSA